ncbi:MAG: four helix bundle protein [Thermodesulfobacteriota bacterium]|nr:four helix bundle protein [Thermodesulfobacteriota bacterium]
MKGDDISRRLVCFSVRIIHLTNSLPKNFIGKHISNQLLRSGTSPGANYEEARGAESIADFIHKLRIALKELRESLYWLNVIKEGNLSHSKELKNISNETEELSKIIAQSIITARKKVK